MAFELCVLKVMKRFKPYILMILLQICYTSIYFITEASFNQGLNPHVYVTHRHVVGALVTLPFAYFLERKLRPKLTLVLFLEIFVLSLLGVSLTLNMYFASMNYTSPAFVTAMINTIPSITFIIAVVFRLEIVDIRSHRGVAKILGTLISIIGVIIIALYRGPEMPSLKSGAPIHLGTNCKSVQKNWLKGSIMTLSSCIAWSILYIMQAFTLKRYPAKLSLTAWMYCIGAAQSAVYTIIVHHKSAVWLTTSKIEIVTIIYTGALTSGISNFIQLWCTKEKGPVFVTIFNPLQTLFVAITAYFLVGEKLHAGCLVGAIIVIAGLYLLLWGKETDQVCNKNQKQSFTSCDELKESKDPTAETQMP